MKLNAEYITHSSGTETVIVATGASSRHFNGLVRSNRTAAYLVECLKTETTETGLVDAMCAKYDAPREVIAHDVAAVLAQLREIGALEE